MNQGWPSTGSSRRVAFTRIRHDGANRVARRFHEDPIVLSPGKHSAQHQPHTAQSEQRRADDTAPGCCINRKVNADRVRDREGSQDIEVDVLDPPKPKRCQRADRVRHMTVTRLNGSLQYDDGDERDRSQSSEGEPCWRRSQARKWIGHRDLCNEGRPVLAISDSAEYRPACGSALSECSSGSPTAGPRHAEGTGPCVNGAYGLHSAAKG